MASARVWLVVSLLVVPSLAGCFADLERVPLETRWAAQGTLHAGPTESVLGRPAQLAVDGSISIANTSEVVLTGVTGTLEGNNGSVSLQPVRLKVANRTLDAPAAADDELTLSTGERVLLTLLPSHGEDARLPEGNWTAKAELLYRYRDGGRFDAGRFTFEANLTLQPAASLGVGVATTNQTGVTSIVFEDLAGHAPASEASLSILHVDGDGVEPVANRTVQVERGEGIATVPLDPAYEVPEGSGYTLFRLEAGEHLGVASRPDRAPEQPLPGPGAMLVGLSIAAVAALLRRRR